MSHAKRYMTITRNAIDDLIKADVPEVYKIEARILAQIAKEELTFPVATLIYQRVIDILMGLDELKLI